VIEDLLDHIGIEDIRPLGEEIQARCPLHEKRTGEREHRPDHWSINRTTGLSHCFSCEYSANLIRLIMDMTGIGLWDAHRLIRTFDVELGRMEETPWEPPLQEVETHLKDFVFPPARAIERRRLTPQAIDRYQLRWDNEDMGWVIPILSPTGEKWGWQVKGDDIRNHPPGIKKSRTLFGFNLLRANHAVLVESPLDVAYLDTFNVPAVAVFGCQVSDLQLKLLIERVDRITLALDNDKAGVRETRRILKEKWHHRIPISVFNYAGMKGKDPGELTPPEVLKGVQTAILASFW
jgi:DNA primase